MLSAPERPARPDGPTLAEVPAIAPRATGLFAHAFVPFLIALSVASWVFRAEGEALLSSWGVPLDFASVVLFGSLGILFVAEQLRPANPAWNYDLLADGKKGWAGWARLGKDLIYLFVVAQVTTAIITLSTLLIGPTLKPFAQTLWPTAAPLPLKVLLSFFLVELASYWIHRATHRIGFLWRFHGTHHAVTELTALKAVRTHPLDNLVFHAARHLPLLFLGAGSDELVAAIFFGATLSLIAHANIRVHEGPLSLFVTYPRVHAVHHSPERAQSNANFGCHTIFWDRLFRTYRAPVSETPEVGLGGKRSLYQELVWPLYRAL